jgi:hypothetical protein
LGQTPPKQAPTKPASVQQFATAETAEQLKKEVVDLKKQIDNLWAQILDHMTEIENLKRASATFDPASPNKYLRVETDAGFLLVSLGKVEPYLDGYKVELLIGNPLAATFDGFEVRATWAPRLKDNSGYLEWNKKKRNQIFSFTQKLITGRWNSTTLIFPETKPDQFGFLDVSLSVNTLSLGTPLSALN